MRHALVILAGCILAFGATVALGGDGDHKWIAVGEFLSLFVMLSGISWLFNKLGLTRKLASPSLIGAFAGLFVIYVSWSVQS